MRARTVTRRPMLKLSAWLIKCHAALSLATAPSFTITMLMLSTQSTQRTVATFNPPRPPSISGSTFFGIPPWIFRLWTNRMSDIAAYGMFASPSPPHYILTLWRIGQNSALLTGTTDTMNCYERVSTTCIIVIIGRQDHEEMMEQSDIRNSLVEFVDRLPSTPVSSESSSASFCSPSLSSTS